MHWHLRLPDVMAYQVKIVFGFAPEQQRNPMLFGLDSLWSAT